MSGMVMSGGDRMISDNEVNRVVMTGVVVVVMSLLSMLVTSGGDCDGDDTRNVVKGNSGVEYSNRDANENGNSGDDCMNGDDTSSNINNNSNLLKRDV